MPLLTKVWRKPGRLCTEIDPILSLEARGKSVAKQAEAASNAATIFIFAEKRKREVREN